MLKRFSLASLPLMLCSFASFHAIPACGCRQPTAEMAVTAQTRFEALRSSTPAPDAGTPGPTRVETMGRGQNRHGMLFRTAGTGITANYKAIKAEFPDFDGDAWVNDAGDGGYSGGIMWGGMNHEKMHACCSPDHFPGPGVSGVDSCAHLGIDIQNALDMCEQASDPSISSGMKDGLCDFMERDSDHWAGSTGAALGCLNGTSPPDPCSGCYASLPSAPDPVPQGWNPIPSCPACN